MSYQLDKDKEIALCEWASANCGGGVDQIQTLTFDTVPTSGIYTLTVDNLTTTELVFDASTADIKSALETLTSLTTVAVTGSYSAGLTVTIENPAKTFVSPIYPNYSALDTDIASSVTQAGVPAIPFIMAYPNAERPPLPYGMLNVIAEVSETNEISEHVSGDVFSNTFFETFMLSVNIYCNNGHISRIRDLKRSVRKSSVRTTLKASGIVCRGDSDIRDLTTLIDTGFEKRAGCDFIFATKDTINETIGYIDRVSGDMEIDDVEVEFDTQ
jgi:hypothetical protein